LQKNSRFNFDGSCRFAFNILKKALLNAPIINPSIWGKPFKNLCEASNEVVGAILGQSDGDNFNIIHHVSWTLNEAQRNYPVVEKELFAIVFSCDKFRSHIIDVVVKAHIDCDGLKEILERTVVKPRMIYWILLLLLQEFQLQIIQRKEEQPKELKKSVSTICIPPGTIKLKGNCSYSLCNCFQTFRESIHAPSEEEEDITQTGGDKLPR
jgi:hypothetical protein